MSTPHRSALYCCICSRALDPDTEAHACPACTHRMRGHLATIVAELPELQACLQLGAAPTGGRGAGRADAPLPLRLDVLNLLGPGWVGAVAEPGEQTGVVPLLPLLTWWADYIAAQHSAAWRSAGTAYTAPCESAGTHGAGVAAWCRWLAAYLPYAITQPWIHQLSGDLAEAVASVRDITRTVPQRHPRLAPCPKCDACALAAVDGEWEITCEACGHQMEPDAYAAHASAVLPELTTIAVLMTAAQHAEDAA